MALGLTVLMGVYLLIRRGYFFDAPPTADMMFVPNKAIAGAGVALLAFTFLLGPIARYFDRLDTWLAYRKEIGIVGGFLAMFHAFISYFLLPLKFPQARFTFESLPFVGGFLGFFLLLFLFIISFKKAIEVIGASRWWFLQRWGLRLVILFTLVHVYAMKWDGWMRWLTQGGGAPTAELAHPEMAGLGILVMLFVTWVVIVRLYESIFLFKDFGLTTKEISLDTVLKARGRTFFVRSLAFLVILFVFVLTRWLV